MLPYGFTENIDFITISQKRLTAQGNETTYIDHTLKLEMYPKQNEKCPKNDTETKQKMSKTKQPKTNIKNRHKP